MRMGNSKANQTETSVKYKVTPTSFSRAKRKRGSGDKPHVIMIDDTAIIHTKTFARTSAVSMSSMPLPQPAWQHLRATKSDDALGTFSRKMIQSVTATKRNQMRSMSLSASAT